MDQKNNHFYLEEVFKEPVEIFSFEYKGVEEMKDNCLFVLDTNILLVPFYTSEKSFSFVKDIYTSLKEQNRLFIPARVAREFAKNRPNKLGDLYLHLRQISSKMNSGNFDIKEFPLLESNKDFIELKKIFDEIKSLIKKSRKQFEIIDKQINDWNWDDPISREYKKIFTKEIIIEISKSREDVVKDLESRIKYKIAPGYKDSSKIDDGIGDLIIWQTILELGKKLKKDIIFVSNETKNDWFHKQDNIALYPRFELYDEYRSYTEGNCVNFINYLQFLELGKVPKETIDRVKDK
ncbi:MAG: hypothetical protein A3K10_01180, partial [Bacteroidetes bacterium RIFCSPLOWO2_12_FULL_31_6]